MSKPGRKSPSPERLARILIDAEELGDERAGSKHHVSARTVRHYRDFYGNDDKVVELCHQYKKALQADWLVRAKEVRRKTLRHLDATLPEATPRELAGIFKIVHEGILAHEVIEQVPHDHNGTDPEPGFEPPLGGTPGQDENPTILN
jgi:hypothetical protein